MPSSRCARTLSLAFSCLIAVPCAAAAQTRPASAGVEAPARLWTAPEGALTLATHPAAMGWVDGVRVRFVHVGSLTGAHLAAGEGTGVYGVAGLPFGIGLGFSAERVQATDGLGNGADYGRLSLGLAWAASRSRCPAGISTCPSRSRRTPSASTTILSITPAGVTRRWV